MTTEVAAVPGTPSPAPAAPAPAPATVVPPSTAPVVPAAPVPAEPKAAEPKSEAVFGTPTEYESTGNANLDLALSWAGSLGLDTTASAEMQAAMQGNFAPLRALLAGKQIPGGDAYIALAEAGLAEVNATKQGREQAVQKMVVQAAGGDEQWAEVFNWASQNAEQAEKDQINAAFEQGGFLAEAVAHMLVANYQRQAGVSVPQPGVPTKDTAGAAPAAGQYTPLSPLEYGREVQKLSAAMRGRQLEGSPEYAALQRRRAAFRG